MVDDGYDKIAAEARMQFYADTVGVEPPKRLLSEDGAPASELLDFCLKYGASLDWIFFGDLRRMIHISYQVARNER